ncbi:hypothetical protein RRG08_007997 [Elysia crispata]|uniref:H-type lectin domain-containing protein n=1 Tax=Elysia crispata TaxID=231223 RepID=A0AAE1B215_9GAST|nr:hypothetical protein RRG08_007997 [Elysia crispata]
MAMMFKFTNVLWCLVSLQALCEGSRLSLTATPDFLTKDITRTLTLRCSLSDTVSPANGTDGNVKYVTSMLVTRNSNNERVAVIDDRSGAKAETDLDSLTVKGDVAHSDPWTTSLPERAYLEMTWTHPGYNQSGGYTCEINAVDLQGHTVVFVSSAEIGLVTATDQDMLDELVRLDSEDQAMKAKLAALEASIATLQPPHAEEGVVKCGDSGSWNRNGNGRYIYKDIRFRKPYLTAPPMVSLAVNTLDAHRNSNLRIHAAVLNVSKQGFRVQCETWDDSHVYEMSMRWTSVVA